MHDWQIKLTFTTPYPLPQETARELWNAGDRFTTVPGARCYEWTVTQGAATAVAATNRAEERLTRLLEAVSLPNPLVYALTAERLHPLRDK